MQRRLVLIGTLAVAAGAAYGAAWFSLSGEGRRDALASDTEGQSYEYVDGWIVARR